MFTHSIKANGKASVELMPEINQSAPEYEAGQKYNSSNKT